MLKKFFLTYRNTSFLILTAILIGILSGLITPLFGHGLDLVTNVRLTYVYILIPLLGTAGVIIIWGYRKFGGASNKGMTLIFEIEHRVNDQIPIRLIPFSIITTWLTHLFGGSAGREGVAIQIGSTVAHNIKKYINIPNYEKIILHVGMAAGFAGLFRTPLVATFFALEVLTVGTIKKQALFPSLTAAYTASYVSGLLGLEKYSVILTDKVTFSWALALQIFVIAIIFGVTGMVFSLSLHKTKEKLAELLPNPFLRIFIVGTVISILSLLCWTGRYSGLGTNLISLSFVHGSYPWDFILKLIFTVLTIAAGFQGGEVTPLFAIGATLGAFLASICGLPIPLGAALGYAAVFGSATNTLIAPIMIGTEVFGSTHFPYFVTVCAIAYVCNRNSSIYPLQRKK